MKKGSFFFIASILVLVGFATSANAQNIQIEDMQKQMMKSMQEQMMKNMGGMGMAGQSPTSAAPMVSEKAVKTGFEVFSDTKLGSNGKSCKGCHPKKGQKPLDGRKVTPHLVAFIQYCYSNALKGPGIMAENKLNALVDYFTSLER